MSLFFFFNDTATTEIYTLSLHDALPICGEGEVLGRDGVAVRSHARAARADVAHLATAVLGVEVGLELQRIEVVLARRSEEHTSELQSLRHLVCRLLLEKKNNHI